MPEQIENSDTISRSIYHPKDYIDGVGVLDLALSFTFQEKHHFCESVNCHRFLGNDPVQLHTLGIQKQEKDNLQGKTPRTYTGFKPANVGKIRTEAKVENITFDVNHSPVTAPPEEINPAHCDIKMGFEGKKPKGARRTLAIRRLCDCFEAQVVYRPAA